MFLPLSSENYSDRSESAIGSMSSVEYTLLVPNVAPLEDATPVVALESLSPAPVSANILNVLPPAVVTASDDAPASAYDISPAAPEFPSGPPVTPVEDTQSLATNLDCCQESNCRPTTEAYIQMPANTARTVNTHTQFVESSFSSSAGFFSFNLD